MEYTDKEYCLEVRGDYLRAKPMQVSQRELDMCEEEERNIRYI